MGGTAPAPRRGWSRAAILGLIFALVLLALMVYASLGLRRESCEVCITFDARTACRKADGSSRDEAIRTATDNACAFLASGMTDSIRCSNTPPESVECGGEYPGASGGRRGGKEGR